jgi:bis(5'-adenosyl)-triphosphatase
MKQGENNSPFDLEKVKEQVFMETRHFMAVYNIAPIVPGHSLIVPKKYAESLFDFSDEELCELILFSKNVASTLRRAFNTKAFNWSIQELEEAGQTVSHFHLHVIPRKVKDLSEPGAWFEKIIDSKSRRRLSKPEIIEAVKHIKKFVTPQEDQP